HRSGAASASAGAGCSAAGAAGVVAVAHTVERCTSVREVSQTLSVVSIRGVHFPLRSASWSSPTVSAYAAGLAATKPAAMRAASVVFRTGACMRVLPLDKSLVSTDAAVRVM